MIARDVTFQKHVFPFSIVPNAQTEVPSTTSMSNDENNLPEYLQQLSERNVIDQNISDSDNIQHLLGEMNNSANTQKVRGNSSTQIPLRMCDRVSRKFLTLKDYFLLQFQLYTVPSCKLR